MKSPRAIASEPENNKIDIDPKMATLTFVDILIKQKQFEQAGNVLKLVARISLLQERVLSNVMLE